MKTKNLDKAKVNVITMGCSKNLVDSENIITQLQGNNIAAEHESIDGDADVIIVNTCGFIESAKEESINTILHYADKKNDGDIEKLYVTGCLSHRYKDELAVEIPEVDAFFGTMELPALLHKFNADYKHELIGERVITTPQHFAYLKISEGCNRTCSFCAIPLMRGKHISQSIEDLVKQAKNLASHGVKELILIAQELTYYGLDIYKKRELPKLLHALAEVENIEWIRLHYAYPSKFPLEIIEAMATHDKVCNYLDMPLQHINDGVLQRMRRQITRADTESLLEAIKEIHPHISLRTTFLVGFPGETEEEFQELCDFVASYRFDRVGVFTYSHEENTSAYELEDDVPEEVKMQRKNRIMEIQQEISDEKNQVLIGQEMKILVDRKEGEFFIGRTEYDSPEVDNEVLIDASKHFVRVGDFVEVRITDAQAYDIFAEPLVNN